jgi:hypothetical protein
MNKLEQLIGQQPDSPRYVELTPTGPVLLQGTVDIASINATERYEVDEPTWDKLLQLLQTGKLDNAKVKAVIKAKKQ